MNHRQWKKKFKKIYGRNPNCWEDKRKRIRYDATVLIGAINEIPSLLVRTCANACEALSQGLAALSEHMMKVAEDIDPNNMTRMFDRVTEMPKDAFKGWTTEELLERIREKSIGEKGTEGKELDGR